MAVIIAISNQKGGVGKTTTSINLSSAIANKGKRVLLIDLDPQGNTTSGLGVNKAEVSRGIYHVLCGESTVDQALMVTGNQNLKLVPASIDLAGAEVELLSRNKREFILKEALEPIKNAFDYILIDCPPSLTVLTLNALTAANKVIVPIQCEFFALEGLGQLMNTVKLVKQHLNPELAVDGVVCTMFDSRTNLSAQVVQEVKKYFASKVYNTTIPRNIRLAEAPSYGLPIDKFDKYCPGSLAYARLAGEVIQRNG